MKMARPFIYSSTRKFAETFNKFMGTIPYFLCCYSHFGGEHVKGHHRHIATSEDPVSSFKGDSVLAEFVITL